MEFLPQHGGIVGPQRPVQCKYGRVGSWVSGNCLPPVRTQKGLRWPSLDGQARVTRGGMLLELLELFEELLEELLEEEVLLLEVLLEEVRLWLEEDVGLVRITAKSYVLQCVLKGPLSDVLV
ncbi:hypothetical protein J1614_011407 [Plenodomus biglobosus]|nr:hypothetical protein J1614_011407 [Plenodomus biglobosus]